MVVVIHRTSTGYSFSRPAGPSEEFWIQAPKGSQLLPVRSVGERLFVPCDRLVRLAWDAADVVRAVRERRGLFKLV